jgi:hypothetical protein
MIEVEGSISRLRLLPEPPRVGFDRRRDHTVDLAGDHGLAPVAQGLSRRYSAVAAASASLGGFCVSRAASARVKAGSPGARITRR